MRWKKGPAENWFESRLIFSLTLTCITSGAAFFWRVLTSDHPLVDFTAFKNRNFVSGSIFSFTMGIGLYGLTYLYPVYLARVQQLFRPADRRNAFRHRRCDVSHRSHRRAGFQPRLTRA